MRRLLPDVVHYHAGVLYFISVSDTSASQTILETIFILLTGRYYLQLCVEEMFSLLPYQVECGFLQHASYSLK